MGKNSLPMDYLAEDLSSLVQERSSSDVWVDVAEVECRVRDIGVCERNEHRA